MSVYGKSLDEFYNNRKSVDEGALVPSPTSFIEESELAGVSETFIEESGYVNFLDEMPLSEQELREFAEELAVDEAIDMDEGHGAKLHPIYVVLTYSDSTFAKTMNKVFKNDKAQKYWHVAIGFGPSLSKLYSFNNNKKVKTNNIKGGLSFESYAYYKKNFPQGLMEVDCMFVSTAKYKAIKRTLNWYIDNKEKTRYDSKNILWMYLNKVTKDSKTKPNLVCSTFCNTILRSAGIYLSDKEANLIMPDDLAKKDSNEKQFKLFDGKIDTFDENKLAEQTEKLANDLNNNYFEGDNDPEEPEDESIEETIKVDKLDGKTLKGIVGDKLGKNDSQHLSSSDKKKIVAAGAVGATAGLVAGAAIKHNVDKARKKKAEKEAAESQESVNESATEKSVKDDIKAIAKKCSGDKSEKKNLKRFIDMDTVKKFMNEMCKYNKEMSYSRVIHVTGDYNYYCQYFGFIKDNVAYIPQVIYDRNAVVPYGDIKTVDVSKSDFDKDLISDLLHFTLIGTSNYPIFRVSKNKITVVIENTSVVDKLRSEYGKEYNFDDSNKWGYVYITKNKEK